MSFERQDKKQKAPKKTRIPKLNPTLLKKYAILDNRRKLNYST